MIDSNVGFVFFVDATVGNSIIELFEQSILNYILWIIKS